MDTPGRDVSMRTWRSTAAAAALLLMPTLTNALAAGAAERGAASVDPLALATPDCRAPADPATEVRCAEFARLAAMVARDVATLDRLWADDLEYGHGNGLVERKRDLLERLRTGAITYARLAPLELDVRVLGDAAIASGRTAVRGESGPMRIDVVLRTLAVYVRRDGRWQLTAYQSAPMAPPAAAR